MFSSILLLYSIFFLQSLHQTLSFTPKSIFILSGQSNMSGRGGVTNNTWNKIIPNQSNPSPSILKLNSNLNWVEANEPLHIDIDYNKTCGIGPGMPFAHTILDHEPGLGPLGLVPCAVGGTSIGHWEKGSVLYRRMIRRARSAGGEIQAFIWFQGESDTVYEDGAVEYGGKLVKLISDLRDDLDDPLLPIVLVAIASGEGPYIDKVREAQMGISLLNVIVVDAMGLPLGPDNLHLTTRAQVLLGEKLGLAFLKFLPRPIQRNVAQNDSLSSIHLHSSYIVWTCIVSAILATLF